MDNFQIQVVSQGRENLEAAIDIAMRKHALAHHYCHSVSPTGMEIFWGLNEGRSDIKPLPFAMKAEALKNFLWEWLRSISPTEFVKYAGPHPGIDGSVKSDAWELTTDGITSGWSYLIFRVSPRWALYGK